MIDAQPPLAGVHFDVNGSLHIRILFHVAPSPYNVPLAGNLIRNYHSSLRTFSLSFAFAIPVTIAVAVAIVALNLDTKYLLCGELPKRLRAVPSFGSVREGVIGNVVVIRVEGIGSSV